MGASSAQASRFALECSIWSLFQMGDVRVWTFTVATPGVDWQPLARMWNNMQRGLLKRYGTVPSVRVTEWHPGGHGWHIHWLMTKFFPVTSVRYEAKKYGWGRIHVYRYAKGEEGARKYFAKHFSKDRRRTKRGMRKWACMGFAGTRVKDIRVESTYSAWRRVVVGADRLSAKEETALRRKFLFAEFGPGRARRAMREIELGPICPF